MSFSTYFSMGIFSDFKVIYWININFYKVFIDGNTEYVELKQTWESFLNWEFRTSNLLDKEEQNDRFKINILV